MNQFKRLIKIWTTKRSSILPIQLTMKTQQTRSRLMKNGNNWFILFFVKIYKKKFLMETFIKEKAIMLVSYRQKLTRRSTYQNKLYATAVVMQQSCNTKRKISRRPRISTSKNSERHFFSFSKDSLRSPYQIVLFFSASPLFCYLESKQMILETSKKQFEISFDWK